MKNIVIYHANCPDGAMAAAVVVRVIRDRSGADVELVPASYQRPLEGYVTAEKVVDGAIFIVDFSFSPEEMTKLGEMVGDEGGCVVMLDHHKSAVERFAGYVPLPNTKIVLDLEHSGAMLAWKHFCGDAPAPLLVENVEDYDLWWHKIPTSKAVHAYLRSMDMDVQLCVGLLDEMLAVGVTYTWHLITSQGAAILRANDQQAKILASHSETVTFAGLTALASNAPLHQDDVGEELARQCSSGVGVLWYWREGRYKVSLRSWSVDGREPFDCSAVAKIYGGGGHRGAASFMCDVLPWR